MSLFGNLNQDDTQIEAKITVLKNISSVDLAAIAENYDMLISTLSKSEGDFITALKAQMEKEKALVGYLQQITDAVVTEIQSARSDFKSADQQYADSKIE